MGGFFDAAKAGLALAKEAESIQAAQIHLAYVHEKLVDAENKIAALEAENAGLLRENRELREQVGSTKEEDKYLDLGMCLIKRNPQGGYFATPLCPTCKKPLSSFHKKILCERCKTYLNEQEVRVAVRKAVLGQLLL